MTYTNRPWFQVYAILKLMVTIGAVVQVVLIECGLISSDYLSYTILALLVFILFEYLESPAMIDLDLEKQIVGVYVPDRRYAYLGLGKHLQNRTWDDDQQLVIQAKRSFFRGMMLQFAIEPKGGSNPRAKGTSVSNWMGVGFYKLAQLKKVLAKEGGTNSWIVRSI